MKDWKRESRELTFTFFVTGVICLIVLGSVYLISDISEKPTYVTFYLDVIVVLIGMFVTPVIFAHLMIEWYNRKWGSQKFQMVIKD